MVSTASDQGQIFPSSRWSSFQEDLYLYCAESELAGIAQRLQSELRTAFPEIDQLPDFTYQLCSEDEFNLAEELAEDIDTAQLHPFLLTQHFSVRVSDLSEATLDVVSDKVFGAVRSAVGSTPYFSFME